MYRKHFGLTRHPFTKDLSPDELFVASAGKELEVRLGHLLELRGIGLVTGEAGSGKTALCRKVVSSLHSGLYRVFYVPLSTGNARRWGSTASWCCPTGWRARRTSPTSRSSAAAPSGSSRCPSSRPYTSSRTSRPAHPARTAAALARLPLAPALRAHLRRLTPPPTQQMPLL